MKRLKLLPVVAIALIGCLDGTGPRRPGGPNALITDAVHGGGNPFFFWLPPMVPNPSPTGTFNGLLTPAVEICQLTGGEDTPCVAGAPVARFTMTSGPGSVIRVVPADQQYIVNWHTDQFPSLLPSPTIYRIQVFDEASVPRVLLGVADIQLADNGKEAKSLTGDQMIGLVDGRTLPIKFRAEVGAVCAAQNANCTEAIVSPAGGEVIVTDPDNANRPVAFASFPDGWTNGPALVRITRIDDSEFDPGFGPLIGVPDGVEQYPLFFEYFTTAPKPFNVPVQIGVCNIGSRGSFHPPDRGTTALALGQTEDHGFMILDPLDPEITDGFLVGCVNVTGGGGSDIGLNSSDGWQSLLARAGELAANVFAPRALEAVVLVDGGMGGSTDFFSPAGTVDTGTAEPAEGDWEPTGSLPDGIGRRDHTATLLASGDVLIVGGTAAGALLYHPTSGAFTATEGPPAFEHGQHASATLLLNGKVLIVGGLNSPFSAELFDPTNGSFSGLESSTNAHRIAHTATLLPDGRVLLAGGQSQDGPAQTHAFAEIYDPDGDTFTPVGSLNDDRSSHGAALLQDGRVLIVGGIQTTTPGIGICLASAELFDTANDEFSSTGSMSIARCGFLSTGAPVLPDGRVLVFGGSGTTAELYSPGTGTFSATGSMATRHESGTSTLLGDGRVLVAGGFIEGGTCPGTFVITNSAEIYNSSTGAFTPASSMAVTRQQQTATRLADGRVLVVGGFSTTPPTECQDTPTAELFSLPPPIP